MNDEYYMRQALKEANKAYLLDEIPVGAVIVYNDKIIARAYNRRETDNSSLAHAEIIAIKKACKKLGSWRLEDCTLYTTLEPCIMCSGAMIQARLKRCIYGAINSRFGAHMSKINIFDVDFNHKVDIQGGVLEEECSILIKDLFKKIRNSK